MNLSGAGHATKVELLTWARKYPVRWEKARIDPDEFRRLRRKGMSYLQLGLHFGRAKSTMVEMGKKCVPSM